MQFFLKALTPPRDFGKKHQVPPPLDFQPVCIYGYLASIIAHIHPVYDAGVRTQPTTS